MGNFSRLFLAIALVQLLLLQPLLAEPQTSHKNYNVLAIHSYHSGLSWTDSLLAGIRDSFTASGYAIQMNAEFLDARRHTDVEGSRRIRELIRYKVKGSAADVVIISDNAALEFALEHHDELFPHTPLVFCGINNFKPSTISKHRGITGVAEDISVAETVDAALRFHPGTQEIIVIGRTSVAADKANRDSFLASLPALPPHLKITFWDDLPMPRLKVNLEKLQKGSVIFINGLIADETGRQLMYGETTQWICQYSPVPAYSLWEVYLGYGIVGGKLVNAYRQGKIAGDLALRILNGESADRIIVTGASEANQYMFDHRQLERFKIPLSLLPEGAVIINRPDSFYEKHKYLVVTTAALFIVLSGLVLMLSVAILRRRRAEEALKKSEARMRLFFERQLVGMAITSPEKGWLQVNERLCKMLGYSRTELEHMTWAELTYPDDLAADIARFDKLLAGEINGYSMEKRFIRKDGTVIFTNLSVGCVHRDDGAVDYVLALLEDITERKQAEEKLRESEERYKNFVEKSFAGVYVVQDGLFVFLNENAASYAGYTPEELIGRHADSIIYPEDREKIRVNVKRMLTGEDLSPYEFRIITKEGQIRWIMETVTSIHYDGRKAILGNAMDITERKRAEEALYESETRYRRLHESMMEAFVSVDMNGHIQETNRAYQSMLGYSEEDLLQLTYPEITPEKWHAFERGIVEMQVLLRGHSDVYEKEYRRKDGTVFPVELRTFLIRNEAGKPAGMWAIVRDITERKRMEGELRSTQDYLRTVFNTGYDAIIIHDLNGKVIDVNDKMLEMYKVSREEAIDLHIIHDYSITENPVDDGFLIWNKVISGKNQFFEWKAKRPKDGSVFDVEVFLTRLLLPDGNFILSNVRDITDRKRAEIALRESEELYRTLIETSPDPILMYSLSGKILTANAQAAKVYGASSVDEFLQEVDTVFDLLSEDSKAFAAANFRYTLREGSSQKNEYLVRMRNGTLIPMEVNSSLVRTVTGEPRAFISVIRDITERKQAEAEIRRLNEELEQRVIARTAELAAVNNELESFAYSISHDLRAPLRGIDGWSLALLEDCADSLDERGQKHLKFVRQETQHMGKLIDALLQLSRLSRTDTQREEVNLSAMARTIAARMQSEEPDRQVEFIIQPRVTAIGDVRLFEVMMSNLLGNAWKFTGKQPSARIEFGRAEMEGQPVYYIRDNGAGFDMSYAGRLFGAFERLHKETDFPGTGIGLATVRRIVNRHGGRVWAEGEVGKGATFYFVLNESGP